jgi:hypothetical protein
MGDRPEDAVEFVVMANHPLKCLATLVPNASPWPPE